MESKEKTESSGDSGDVASHARPELEPDGDKEQKGSLGAAIQSKIKTFVVSILIAFVFLILVFLGTGGDWEDIQSDGRYLTMLGFLALIAGGMSVSRK